MGPNVVVLVLDTARADAFEPYGARPGSSPVVADVASGGGVLTHAYATSNWTIPSHASMFTGELPLALGFGHTPGNWGTQCRPVLEANQHRLLPSVLQAAGYATFGVSANAWITPRTGFGLGFDEFRIARGRRYEGIAEPGVKARLKWARQAVRARIDDGAGQAASIADAWLDELGGRPFFLFVNLVECHSPYLPPQPHNSLSPWQRFLAGEDARRHLTLEQIFRINAGGFDVPDGAIERMRVLYADAVRSMDTWIGRLVDGLDRRGLLGDTLLAITSDHGEHLGENRLLGHAMSLSDWLIRVPFVWRGPGAQTVDRPFSLTEVPAMIADAVGLDDHPWRASSLPGGAAVAQYDAPARHDPDRATAFARTHRLGEEAARRLTRREVCATDGRHKLLRRDDGTELLYDLGADPTEASPSPVGPRTEVPDGLRTALVAAEASVPAAPVGTADEGELDELEGQLRLLGYL